MKKISKIVAGVVLAGMTILFCAGASAEEVQVQGKKVRGFLYFAQPIEKVEEYFVQSSGNIPLYFDDLNSLLLALQAKKVDSALRFPQPVAEYICNHNQKMQVVLPPYEKYRGNLFLRMGTMPNNTKVAELLNSAIKELQVNGKLDALQKKYVDECLQKGKEPKAVTLPKFKDAQVIKVAVTGDNPPIDLVAADGTPAGFNVAMLAEIAKLKKVNIIPIPMNSGARFISLTKGIVDAIFFIDEAVFSDAKITEFNAETDLPKNICVTDAYAKYPIRYVVRK